MAFLLDTDVVRETVRPGPRRSVLDWIKAHNLSGLFLAAQTIGELVRGARKVTAQERRERFERWIERDLARQFDGRVLPFDDRTAAIWGRLMDDGERVGRRPAAAAAHIAAVAIQHELILVTRNVRDFARFDLQLLSPWREEEAR